LDKLAKDIIWPDKNSLSFIINGMRILNFFAFIVKLKNNGVYNFLLKRDLNILNAYFNKILLLINNKIQGL
jgi:hypothetical protein